MALIKKGNLSTWLVAAAIGIGGLAHKYTDEIAQMIADKHEPVQGLTGGESLRSAFSIMRGGGSDDLLADKTAQGLSPQNISPPDTESYQEDEEDRIRFVLEDYEISVTEIFNDPESREIEKFHALNMFYDRLRNPEDTARIPGFRSHAEFIQHIRNQAVIAIKSLQSEIQRNPDDSVGNYHTAKDILNNYSFAGYNGRLTEKELEEGKEHDDFDFDYAAQVTGINEEQWNEYLKPLSVIVGKNALQDFRAGYSPAP